VPVPATSVTFSILLPYSLNTLSYCLLLDLAVLVRVVVKNFLASSVKNQELLNTLLAFSQNFCINAVA
jgi:DNA-binding PucR family transcriptional regulator